MVKQYEYKNWKFIIQKILKRNYLILREFKYFFIIAILALVFSILAAIFEGVSIGLLVPFLQKLTTPNAEPFQIGINWFDTFILGIDTSVTSRLYRISILILVATWIRAGFNYLAQLNTELVQLNLGDRLRKQVFEQLQSLPIIYFNKNSSSEIVNTLTIEIERVKQGFSGASFLLTRGLTTIVYLIFMLIISWQLTIVSVLLFSLLGVGFKTLNAKIRERSFGMSTANGKFTSTAMEFIQGIRTVHAFTTQDFERQRYYQASENVIHASKKVALTWTLIKPFAEGIATTIIVSMIILAFSRYVVIGSLQVASLLTFFFVLFRLVPIMQDVNATMAFISTLQGSINNIQELLRRDNKNYFQNGSILFPGLKKGIDLISVDFGYDKKHLVLQNITLSIERGKMTALVGGTGAGKTTLADLIPRFYDVTDGIISIDGIDIKQLEVNSLRNKMAVVSQDTFIFNDSVWNNIAYGRKEATQAEIKQVAILANAIDFIQDMPEGFDSILGDRGVRLSGGQRQRIAIARALLRNPEILILDEATSALDSVTEKLIQESLETLAVGKTVIVIAHRLSTIAKADKVIVLEHGKIIEQGNYQELLKLRGKLWQYHKTQYEMQ
ncbi:ATP-binding protein; heterocyst differentiation protein of ABC transporter [Richelia intracellularis HH01]|uniref:ATP-binding protein heterocyst differentiation protein of ABC transporter n=1 Tax=Richelia intracellularis HH01 TaxID=1165094 RepID=M1X252_9NOST|nr:heterocyst formation ABC transporter subunit HepA [Richelia intracellularis]CCH66220.1 ATP-binding protein; heterocyst differentiation protein of ABC transporter [Richelia intracellularis HH01]